MKKGNSPLLPSDRASQAVCSRQVASRSASSAYVAMLHSGLSPATFMAMLSNSPTNYFTLCGVAI